MKYKVGDKVRVRQDLVEGEKYGAYPWNALMKCKYIVVDKVNTNSYYAESNWKFFSYTDEMLDGLLYEPVKEPTDAELIAAAESEKAGEDE